MARKSDIQVFINKYNPHMEDSCIKQYDYWHNIESGEAEKANKENKLWTCVDGDNGNWYLSPGKHLVNRLFYVICNKPWTTFEETKDYRY